MNILKEKRLEKNMTLEDVGNLVGVGKSTVRKWENGMIENMGRDKIVAISKALGISPLDILGMSENDLPQSTIEAIYNQLEKPRQVKVYNFAERQLQEQDNAPKVVQLPIIEDDKEIEILSGHESAAGFAILGDDSNMTSTVMKASKVPNGADEVVEIKGNSMEPLIMNGEQVFIRHQPSVENGEIAIVAIIDDGITCKKVYYDDAEGTVTLESVNDDYEDMVFPVEDIRIIGKVLGK
ncbi:DNA-binding protein [Carnobacterium divergens]|uniref:helix-turn-helix domain-containing protein n=1 Tax=Carnobacterium divergens TaxID=2748 RepID=UPI001071D140|nr:XRE family transcriptional regulator [Carnobacterium divergens]MDT1995655.1 XRE family transcriptional regulator [Carnobacterium divergens]TFI66680.1 DNA-binding protein [Carnobacterium divergens]TFI78974.1 DNA-binding protein [Carnobacterium divergens]TFI86114.1 DNA-binding protein [Carnobacterium divergens]TFI95333.1 DNA-binding protein [Carnobacterium divergens]